MLIIYKYPFEIADRVVVDLPRGAKILKVEAQQGTPCLWALVDTNRELVPWTFLIVGTGHRLDERRDAIGKHIATFQQRSFVWHVFHDLDAQRKELANA